jgi:uncharacterized membrane protein
MVPLCLMGAASLAVTGIIDKVILDRYVRNSNAYLVALIILQQIFAVVIFVLAGPGFVYPQSLYALAVGVIQAIYWAAYFRALKVEETSRIAAMVYVYPVFVFPAAYIFLGEVLSLQNYLGGLFLVLSAMLVSYKPSIQKGSLILSPALKYMFIFWISYAAYTIAAKYLLAFMDEWHLLMWLSLGNLVILLPFLGRRDLRDESFGIIRGGRFLLSAMMLEEVFSFLGRAALIFAYAVGSVTLVSSVAALQPFLTLVYVIAFSLLIPGVLTEELDMKTLSFKLLAVLLIVAGVYFVS